VFAPSSRVSGWSWWVLVVLVAVRGCWWAFWFQMGTRGSLTPVRFFVPVRFQAPVRFLSVLGPFRGHQTGKKRDKFIPWWLQNKSRIPFATENSFPKLVRWKPKQAHGRVGGDKIGLGRALGHR